MNWYWARRLFVSRLPSVKNWVLFLLMVIHLEKNDGAIEFWRLMKYLRNDLVQFYHWSDEKWKSTMSSRRKNKKKFNIVLDPSKQTFFVPEFFKVIQDVISLIFHYRSTYYSNGFFECIYNIRCASNLHSMMNSGSISGRPKLEAKTNGILHACGSNEQENQRFGWNWSGCTASCLIQGQSRGKISKHGGTTSNVLKRKDLNSIKHDRMQSSFTTSSHLIVSRRLSWWELEKQIWESISAASISSEDFH